MRWGEMGQNFWCVRAASVILALVFLTTIRTSTPKLRNETLQRILSWQLRSPPNVPPRTPQKTVNRDIEVGNSTTQTPFKPTSSLNSEATLSRRALRLSTKLVGNMVDCPASLFGKLYNELTTELPIFASVRWDDIIISLRACEEWPAWVEKPSQYNLNEVLQRLCDIIHSTMKDQIQDRPRKQIRFMGDTVVPASAPENSSKWPL